jgi:hypothetical protein
MLNYQAQPFAKRGVVTLCSYCGEEAKGMYCNACKTQKGRKEIFEANVKIYKENEKKGITVPSTMKNWK